MKDPDEPGRQVRPTDLFQKEMLRYVIQNAVKIASSLR